MSNVPLLKVLNTDGVKGALLLVALLFILIIANSPLYLHYQHLIEFPIFSQPLLFWVNDILMVGFFLMLALEIKREILVGELRNPAQVVLPIAAACGGVIAPALIYFALVGHHDAQALRGWGIPVATDVALALGLLALLGKRVPTSLKIFLAVLAIADDLIAIIIIAAFYTAHLAVLYLGLAVISIIVLIALNYFKISALKIYFLVGIVLWFALLKGGVHPTLAGVILGFCIPLTKPSTTPQYPIVSPLKHLEKILAPWVAFLILPIFVLANAGIPMLHYQAKDLLQPVALGIVLGLFIGKQLGIMLVAFILTKLKLAHLPTHSTWWQFYGIAILAGLGFTMSLFISALAFDGTAFAEISRVGIILGSALSAIIGLLILYFSRSSFKASV